MLYVRDFLKDQRILRSDNTPENPTVSIVLPTFARFASGLLERAIRSILAQSFTDWELLVIDDGSTDGTFDLVESFRKKDRRIIHVRHENNSGIHSLRLNEGIELAQGKFLIFQFDDDYWRRSALQVLVETSMKRHEPALVAARALLKIEGKERLLPEGDVDYRNLIHSNQLANNNVLFPRAIADELGMYDCHLGMRRLCDWDLWLRYCRQFPIVIADPITAEIQAAQTGSIGLTLPWDLALFRYLHEIPRNHLLRPGAWHDYAIDALKIGEVKISSEFSERLHERYIAPYYLKRHLSLPPIEKSLAAKTALLVRSGCEPTHEIAFNHYDSVSCRRGQYKAYYQLVDQIGSSWQNESDLLLLVRSTEHEAKDLMAEALISGKPVGYYLDDDLLAFHEYGSDFDYLAPGSAAYQNISDLLEGADAVWCNTPYLESSVKAHNSRTVPHHGCIPKEWLPSQIRPRGQKGAIRIGYVGTGYHTEEFQILWPALQEISQEFRDRLNFEFWGLDISRFPSLASPAISRDYDPAYRRYMARLQKAEFDLMLVPLLDRPGVKLAKSVSKYFQAAAAGALGLFSNAPQYSILPAGLTCLKPDNSVESWHEALHIAITMPSEQFDLMRRRMIEHVKDEYTETAQIHLHEAAWRATEFHAKTRRLRGADGRPRILYVFHSSLPGGSEIQLLRRMRIARRYGVQPIAVLNREPLDLHRILAEEQFEMELADYTCFTEPRSPEEFCSQDERAQVYELLKRRSPALVHSLIFNPTFGQICSELKIPHIASVYAVDDAFSWTSGHKAFDHCNIVQSDSLRYASRWSKLLGSEPFCSREPAPEEAFALGQSRFLDNIDNCGHSPKRMRIIMMGTLQERKRQLEAIQAVSSLIQKGWDCRLDIYGCQNLNPEYSAKCRKCAKALDAEKQIAFHDFTDNIVPILRTADILLSASSYESFPNSIKEAMAAGALIVAAPAGGIPELIEDRSTGILCQDSSIEGLADGIRQALSIDKTERRLIIEQARRIARSEFHPQRIANDMFQIYNRAIELNCNPAFEEKPDIALLIKRGKVENPAQKHASDIILRRRLDYFFSPKHSHWNGISIYIGTHQRPAKGAIKLQVFSESGALLREAVRNLVKILDNSWVELRFTSLPDSAAQKFKLRFSLIGADSQTKISLYEIDMPQPRILRLLRSLGLATSSRALYCKSWFQE